MNCVRNPDRLVQALRLVNDLPPLSPMVRHLLETLYSRTDDAPLSQVAVWIEKDPLTSGKVLALANSAYYARSEPIVSIRHAVSRLGLIAIRNLVTTMSMTRYWKRIPTSPDWSVSRFNTHSIAVALLSEMIASTMRTDNAETAFMAGLFHDIGQVGIAVLLQEDKEAAKQLLQDPQSEQLEFELLGFSHAELSGVIVRSWNLPKSIENAVRYHEAEIDWERIGRGEVLLSDIVHVADDYVDSQGLSISGMARKRDDVPTLEKLGLTEQTAIFARFHDELETLLSVM